MSHISSANSHQSHQRKPKAQNTSPIPTTAWEVQHCFRYKMTGISHSL